MAHTRWPSGGGDCVVGWPKRIALGVSGASFGATAASAVDALWARTSAGTQPAALLPLARFDVGVNAPIALAMGAAAALFGILIEPDRARSPTELLQALVLSDAARRRRLAASLVSLAVFAPLWATAVGHFAKKSMAAEGSNVASGLTMATAALVLALAALTIALALGDLVARALAPPP